MMKIKKLMVLTSLFILSACGGGSSDPVAVAEEDRVGSLPLEIIEPESNPTTDDKVMLGRMLFWDPVLSGNQDVACATCHHPDNAYAEHLDITMGVGGIGLSENRHSGTLAIRNSQTILNTAYNGIDTNGNYDPENTAMFWDNRVNSLEEQALNPIRSAEEMRGTAFSEEDILEVVINRLASTPKYVLLFEQAFGDSVISETRIAQAIAAFERALLSNNSRFDQYARGDDNALTDQEIRGLNAFNDAGCNVCHVGPMFSDFELHNLSVEHNDKLAEVDNGVDGKFRTPSLRNVALTAPYMHNGTVATLRDAINFYGGIENPSNDPDLAQLDFDNDASGVIEAFLRTLTDENFDKTIPDSVPSGLNPGGDIN